MSDFLSNFTSDKYKHTLKEKTDEKMNKEPESSSEKDQTKNLVNEPELIELPDQFLQEEKTNDAPTSQKIASDSKEEKESKREALKKKRMRTREQSSKAKEPVQQKKKSLEQQETSREELTETDPTYKKRQLKKWSVIVGLLVVIIALSAWGYYQWSYVKIPDFSDKPLSDARAWTEENNVKLAVEQEYSEKIAANQTLKQKPAAGQKIKKGKTLNIIASMGPDPDSKIALPDFSKMSEENAKQWSKDHQAENLAILNEYSDTVEKGKFIKEEFANKEISADNYRRKDSAKVYYSKGKEVFEKNISVPDFANKPKTEVETWSKNNGVKINFKTSDSDTVAANLVISQGVPKDSKVAKNDTVDVVISQGKAVIVPNFGDITPDGASGIEGLAVAVQQRYSNDVPYGQLIAQSIPAGTRIVGPEVSAMQVVYSLGRPYLKSCKGQLEGDLPKIFYDEYHSRGADIKYRTVYVNSSEEKGTVIDMSAFNQYVPLDYTVTIVVSLGN